MKTPHEAAKDQTAKTQPKAPKAKTPKAKPEPVAKADAKPDVETDAEPADRLPATVEELKASKSGLVSFLFLSGKDKDTIAKELTAAFALTDVQAMKITRRITARARFFQRAFALAAAK